MIKLAQRTTAVLVVYLGIECYDNLGVSIGIWVLFVSGRIFSRRGTVCTRVPWSEVDREQHISAQHQQQSTQHYEQQVIEHH